VKFFYEKEYKKLLKDNKLPGRTISPDDLQSAWHSPDSLTWTLISTLYFSSMKSMIKEPM